MHPKTAECGAVSGPEAGQIVFESVSGSPIEAPPTRRTASSVGYDLPVDIKGRSVNVYCGREKTVVEVSGDEILVPPGHTALIPLGFRTRFEPPLEAQLRLRSSVGLRGFIMPNAPGTIDPDYRDEWKAAITNVSPHPQPVTHGERLVQVVFSFSVVTRVEWSVGAVGVSDRVGGFGSTGR
jgi:dUTP pyrophosphatase